MTDRFAVSEPGFIPSGIVLTMPISDFWLSASSAGVFAYARGVRPFSLAIGSSAIPSPSTTTYFIINPPLRGCG